VPSAADPASQPPPELPGPAVKHGRPGQAAAAVPPTAPSAAQPSPTRHHTPGTPTRPTAPVRRRPGTAAPTPRDIARSRQIDPHFQNHRIGNATPRPSSPPRYAASMRNATETRSIIVDCPVWWVGRRGVVTVAGGESMIVGYGRGGGVFGSGVVGCAGLYGVAGRDRHRSRGPAGSATGVRVGSFRRMSRRT